MQLRNTSDVNVLPTISFNVNLLLNQEMTFLELQSVTVLVVSSRTVSHSKPVV
jgi:hypothetical protein